MTPLAAALTGIAILGGLMLVIVGFVQVPVVAKPPGPLDRLGRWFTGKGNGSNTRDARRRQMLILGFVVGLIAWLVTKWLVLVFIVPAALVGIPLLLGKGRGSDTVSKLEAMEEWTRSLAGVLTVGVGIEQAITATVRSAPDAIQPDVQTLAARLRARWGTVSALRAFADDLDDATGDLIASSLILGATRRGAGLANVLEGLAETVAQDVRVRRQIEADRAKPRTTARIVTIITLVVLGMMAFNGTYIAPYGSGIGQVILLVLLGMYVGCLMWMQAITRAKPLPRIMGRALRASLQQQRRARAEAEVA